MTPYNKSPKRRKLIGTDRFPEEFYRHSGGRVLAQDGCDLIMINVDSCKAVKICMVADTMDPPVVNRVDDGLRTNLQSLRGPRNMLPAMLSFQGSRSDQTVGQRSADSRHVHRYI